MFMMIMMIANFYNYVFSLILEHGVLLSVATGVGSLILSGLHSPSLFYPNFTKFSSWLLSPIFPAHFTDQSIIIQQFFDMA